MKIAKPMLLVLTPLGVAYGLYEAWRLAGGLVFVLAAAIGVFGTAMATVVVTARREQAAERARQAQADAKSTAENGTDGKSAGNGVS